MGNNTEYQYNWEILETAAWCVALLYEILLCHCLQQYICKNFKRISSIKDLPENCAGMIRYGVVAGIPDGDGFWFFDCPWLRSSLYSHSDSKLHVRLAGIDAPEMGDPPRKRRQFFAGESKEHLQALIRGKSIKIKILGVDQYGRVLAFAYLPRWYIRPFFNWLFPVSHIEWFQKESLYINVNLEQVADGCAVVYTGTHAKYDDYEKELKNLEAKAKREKKGMWIRPNSETPMSYKRRMKDR